MKKLLIITLIILLVILLGYVCIQGFSVGTINVLSISQIQAKNNELNIQIEKATKLASTDYKKAVSDIDSSIQKLEKEKKSYEDMVTITTSEDITIANQLEKYEVEYLWTKIGNHATSEGATIKLDITNGTSLAEPVANTQLENKTVNIEQINSTQNNNYSEKTYNLNFTVTGAYVGIADFIYAIENDSSLAFKIEQFKLTPSSGTSELKATFVCKDISIKDITQTTTKTGSDKKTENTTNNTNTVENTTNNTNTAENNSTANTTNNNTNTTSINTQNATNPNAR